jgi:glycosyltransferase involved in cell wall biosynthesis
MPSLDLIVPVYNEALVLSQFLQEARTVLESLPDWQTRIILVNDGSQDQTLAIAQEWQAQLPGIVIVDLSRNFGHEAAMAAGLAASTAQVAIIMDGDLQDPPELIPALLEQHKAGYDVVNAFRESRRADSWCKRLGARFFYWLINAMAGPVKIPTNVGNYRLLSRRVVGILNQLPERNRVLRVLIPYLGFPTTSVAYPRPNRKAGKSHYNYRSMISLAIDGITSATRIPLQFATRLGLLISFLGFGYLSWVLIQALVLKTTVDGWASLMCVILFLGGVQLIVLGVLGEYLGRLFLEVKGRPNHVVQAVYTSPPDPRK